MVISSSKKDGRRSLDISLAAWRLREEFHFLYLISTAPVWRPTHHVPRGEERTLSQMTRPYLSADIQIPLPG